MRANARRSRTNRRRAGHVAGLERANAPVHDLRAIERSSAPEISAVDDADGQAAQRRVPGGDCAVYAATHDEKIERPGGESREIASHLVRPGGSGGAVDGNSTTLRQAIALNDQGSISLGPDRLRWHPGYTPVAMTTAPGDESHLLTERIRAYWNERIHDLGTTAAPIGTLKFFMELDEYRFDKLRYLPLAVDFNRFRGRRLLEVGCGVGTDLVRFARAGARVTGIDVAERVVELARRNVELRGLKVDELRAANGEALPYKEGTFDAVYAHGVIQYAADPLRLIQEAHRVLKSGGEAIFMVCNRYSWLYGLSVVMRVGLEHADAPVSRTHSIAEYRRLLAVFETARIVPERFPVHSRLHGGLEGMAL